MVDCAACRGELPRLTAHEIATRQQHLPREWRVIGGHHLERDYAFPDFREALAFANRVGNVAEAQGHHPDIHVSWGRVRLTIWTHKADGVTVSDFTLAAAADEVL